MNRLKETVRRVAARSMAAALRRASEPLPAIDGLVLVVAPHPDDEVLGCGGLIARQARAGRRVRVLFVTDGEASHRGHPILRPETLARQRREEAIAALTTLGVVNPRSTATFLGAPDGQLDKLPPDDRTRLVETLANWFRAERPEVVCTPFHGGGSSEHDAVTAMVELALASAGGGGLMQYPVWAWWNALRLRRQLASGARNCRLELGDLRLVKAQAIACHRTQVAPVPPWKEAVLPDILQVACAAADELYFPRGVAPRP